MFVFTFRLFTATWIGAGSELSQAEGAAAKFQALARLPGATWVGRFPDGKQTDSHRFEWVYGQKFIRDTHQVKDASGKVVYEGETIFAWDEKQQQIVYFYFNVLGGTSQGSMVPEGDALVSYANYSGSADSVTETKSVTTEVTAASYTVSQYFKVDGDWREQWTITFMKQ